MNSLSTGDRSTFCKEERFKSEAFARGGATVGDLPSELRAARVNSDLSESAKHLAKSHG